MDTRSSKKIFFVGFNKCATTTLHGFLAGNGTPSIHWDEGRIATRMVANALAGRKILAGYDRRYVAFSDMICLTDRICIEGNSFYRVLDADYPNSRFIYNTRQEESWLRSRARHRNGEFLSRYKRVLNTSLDSEVIEYWRSSRRSFETGLRSYFAGRSDLLIYDIDQHSPERISEFLGMDLSGGEYGWRNRTVRGEAARVSTLKRIRDHFFRLPR